MKKESNAKTGVWLNYPGVHLEDGQVILVRLRGKSWYEMVTYNAYEDCFDDADGDDYYCDIEDVCQVLLIPEFDD